MAQNQSSANSEGACEKIYKAIFCISCCPESTEPTSAAPSSLPLLPDQEKTTPKVMSTEVPIKFNTPAEQTSKTYSTSIQKNGQVTRVSPHNELVPTRVAESDKAKRVVDIAQPEKAILEREQLKPKAERASSSSAAAMAQSKGEEGKNPGGLDNGNEKFSNYIDHAKAKIRTTSSVGGGGGKSASRLDSFHDRVTNYINRAKVRIRTNSSAGFGKSVSIK